MQPQRTLLAHLQAFRSYRYGLRDVTYPWALPGVRLKVAPPDGPFITNCCCFAEALLVHAFAPQWSLKLHNAFMINTPDIFGPVHAAIEAGMARPLDNEDYFTPGVMWRLVQGWRNNGRGHCFIVARVEDDGRVLILESNQAYKVQGVGYRDAGSLRDLESAPKLPLETPSTWTGARLRRTYVKLRACALNVSNDTA